MAVFAAMARIAAWEFHNYNSGAAGIQTYYEIPNQRIEFHSTRSPLRQGSYRALAATANHFARESHMDELAHLVKMDPLEFRLKNLKNERLRAVFEAAAKKFGWGQTKPAGHGFGMGGGFEKAGNIATCAEVVVDQKSREVKVLRVLSAFECGAIVNPDNLRNQIEGSNIMGLGGALFEAIEFENGTYPERQILEVSRSAIQRCASGRDRAARSQGHPVSRRGRMPNDRVSSSHRQRHFRCDGCAAPFTAHDSEWVESRLARLCSGCSAVSLLNDG